MPENPQHEALMRQIAQARDALYRSIGELDEDILTPLINPTFTGGPRWPSLRQGWRTLRRQGHTLVASDGLSDPFDDVDGPTVGFGVEFILETDEPVEHLPGSWPFQVVYEVSQLAANHRGIRNMLEELGCISTEIPVDGVPDELRAGEGCVGVLIGTPAPSLPSVVDTPGGEVRLVPVTLLMPEELDHIVKNGHRGRDEIAQALGQRPLGHVSRLSRPPVV